MGLGEFAADGVTVGEDGNVGEAREKLVEVRFECIPRLATAANEHRCDLLVVAGDMFDRVTVAKRDVVRAAAAFADFEGAVKGNVLVTHEARPYSPPISRRSFSPIPDELRHVMGFP